MDTKGLIIGVLGLICVILVQSVCAETANPYALISDQEALIHEQVTDIMGMTLQDIADGYSSYSRIGWKIAINGIDESAGNTKVECGFGYITGYDSSTGILSGMGQMYEISPGSSAGNPVVQSLDTASISIQVDENRMTISTSGSNPGQGTAWAQILGTYSNLQDGGHRIFYGFGNNPDYSASMCILTFSNLQGSTTSDQNNEVGYIGTVYYDVTPTPTPVIRKTMNYPTSK